MHSDRKTALADRLCRYDRLVEVGVGNRPDIAIEVAERGRRVTATDIYARPVSDAVRFVIDDVTDPDLAVYQGADAVYALNCPPELQRSLADIATAVGADCLFTTLGGDPVVVDATPETLSGDTLFELNT